MTTPAKPRFSVRADSSPTVEAIVRKAVNDVADAVDIQPRYNEDFQAGLMDSTTETGIPLPASGNGTQLMAREYSDLPAQVQTLATLYTEFATKMDGRLDRMEKAVGLLLAAKAGMSKSPDWQSKQAKKEDTNDDDDKPSDDDVEKAVTAVKSGKASVKDVMLFLQHGQREPLRSPPDMSAFMKAHSGDGPSDSEIDSMDLESATEALMERQRSYKRAQIAAGKLVLQPLNW